MSKVITVAFTLLVVLSAPASAQLQLVPPLMEAFAGAFVRGAGQAAGTYTMNRILKGSAQTSPSPQFTPAPTYSSPVNPKSTPALPPEYAESEPDFLPPGVLPPYEPRTYNPPQRICRTIYHRELVERVFVGRQITGRIYLGNGVTRIFWRNNYVNHYRTYPVQVC